MMSDLGSDNVKSCVRSDALYRELVNPRLGLS